MWLGIAWPGWREVNRGNFTAIFQTHIIYQAGLYPLDSRTVDHGPAQEGRCY
jgi:hypothetical protein